MKLKLKDERKIEIHDCIPVDKADSERWKMSDDLQCQRYVSGKSQVSLRLRPI